jgi:dTDP-4-amino-4,6-dideoxygalactose transaminase
MKTRVVDLAIFGSPPAFGATLHVGRPNVGDRARLLERIGDALDRRWLSNNGPFVQELEARIAAMIGVRHCIAVCNATAGLEIAIRATGLGGEVIVPSFTFVATAHALHWLGIKPVFCDVDPCTHTLDPRRVEELVTDRTSGIIGVHLWGRPCDVEGLEDVARRHGLTLLFDAAHAFGCSYRGRPVGRFGACEVFSFHATKFFNTFEGGAIVTDDDELAHAVRLMSNFGFTGYDTVVSAGINGKMSEVAAAMGLTGLESLEEFVAVNARNYRAYAEGLRGIPGLRLLPFPEGEACNYQYVVLEIDETTTSLSRDQLAAVLHAENVFARRYFSPGCHNMEPYRTLYPEARLALPQTERLARSVLTLPTGTAVTERDVAVICRIIRVAVGNGEAVRALLGVGPSPAVAARPAVEAVEA